MNLTVIHLLLFGLRVSRTALSSRRRLDRRCGRGRGGPGRSACSCRWWSRGRGGRGGTLRDRWSLDVAMHNLHKHYMNWISHWYSIDVEVAAGLFLMLSLGQQTGSRCVRPWRRTVPWKSQKKRWTRLKTWMKTIGWARTASNCCPLQSWKRPIETTWRTAKRRRPRDGGGVYGRFFVVRSFFVNFVYVVDVWLAKWPRFGDIIRYCIHLCLGGLTDFQNKNPTVWFHMLLSWLPALGLGKKVLFISSSQSQGQALPDTHNTLQSRRGYPLPPSVPLTDWVWSGS